MCELKNNEYLKTMKPMLYLMKMVCALPICLKPQNEVPYFLSSRLVSFVIVATCTLVHISYIIYALTDDVFMDENIWNAVNLVVKGPTVMIELFCLEVPMLMWNRNEEMQNYWNAWANFQSKFETISGAPFVSRKRKYVQISALICIAWNTLLCFHSVWFHFDIYINFIDFFAGSYLAFKTCIIAMYWITNCAYFWSISEDVMNLGKKIISKKKEEEKLNQLVSLWSTLNDVTKTFNEAHSFLFLSYLLLTLICIVTFCYALLNYSTYKVIYPFSYYGDMLFISLFLLLTICETAHKVYIHIHHRQKEALLQENTMEMEPAALKFIYQFLQTISTQNSAIVLNGLVTLNRREFPAIVAICINYLIVLRQFSGD